jgi:protein-S-isoprenylcysteine O-methyltransferase Ste14
VIGGLVMGGGLMIVGGTIGWPAFWVWIALFGVGGIASALLAPETVLRERMRGPVRSGQARGDRDFVAVFGVLVIGWFALLAIDQRLELSSLPSALRVAGAVLYLAANAAIVWVLRANPHASGSVRIADDHKVATTGPYRIVRHPMYASVIPYLVGTALLLDSLLGVIASILLTGALGVRTIIEERELNQKLPGYTEYTANIRWRLVPGIW